MVLYWSGRGKIKQETRSCCIGWTGKGLSRDLKEIRERDRSYLRNRASSRGRAEQVKDPDSGCVRKGELGVCWWVGFGM